MQVPGEASTTTRQVTAGEVALLAAVVLVVGLAEAGLVLMHLRAWTLPGALAGAAVLAAIALVLLGRRRPAIVLAPAQLAVLAAVGLVAVLFATPGFPVGMAGWDPGVYTNHGLAIARTGDFDLPDPALAVEPALPHGTADTPRFPGTSYSRSDGDRSEVGFYHLYPALLAPAADVAGERGVVNVNPVLGALTALLMVLVGWRAFGPVAGALAGLLTATNTIQVWHARLPSSEVLTELLVVTALLGILLARDTGWRAVAGLAGVLTGAVFLVRGDGFTILLLAAGALLLLALTGTFDRRAGWFAAGVAVTLPHSLLQAYELAEIYTVSQGIPGKAKLGGALVLLAVGTVLAWRLRPTVVGRAVDDVVRRLRQPGLQRWAGVAVVAAFAVLVLVNYLRPLWMTERPPDSVLGGSVPYYNARAMLRLTWYFTPVGIAAVFVGVAVVALRRWSFPRWVVVLPSLAVLPVYLADARIAARLIWWTRRFVPFAMPGLLLLVAVGLTAALLWSGRGRWVVRGAGAVATVAVVASWWAMSWPLRDHDELDGSFTVYHHLDAVAGDEPAAWLWSTAGTPLGYTPATDAFASTVLYRRGDAVARFDEGRGDELVDAYRGAFPDRPLFVVADGHEPPADVTADLEKVRTVDVRLPLWELTYDRRPTKPIPMAFLFTVWRVAGTG